jgi:hypothetical protein
MRLRVPVLIGLGLLAMSGDSTRATEVEPVTVLSEAQVAYLEHCGGCHGIQGSSAPHEVPSLRGQAGYFLCLPEARAYLIRLPSVARSPLADATLADLMNFVVFDIGGRLEHRPAYGPYTAEEVRHLRKRPLNDISLASYREALVERLIRQCGAPASLRDYSSTRAH